MTRAIQLVGLLFLVFLFSAALNASNGSFQPPMSFPVGVSPRGIAMGDVFGNGVQNLIVANFGAPTFIGQSTPSTLLYPQNSTVQIFSPSPEGLKLMHTIPTGSSPRGICLYDLEKSGGKNILVTAYDLNLLQVFHLKEGQFVKSDEQPTLTMPVGITAGLTRPGGNIFVVVTDYGSKAISLFQVANGKLGKRSDVTVDEGPTQAAIGDLNGDGINEIAVACLPANRVNILSQGGAGDAEELPLFTVTSSITLPDGSGPADLRVTDLNGDGRSDMVVANFSKNTLSIFFQQNNGSLAAQPLLSTTGNRPNGLTVGDLYGDGSKEIIVANRDSDILDIFQMMGGSYQLTQSLKVSEDSNNSFGPVEVGVMDTQNDGNMDLVTSHMRSNTIKVLTQMAVAIPTLTPTASVEQGTPFSEKTTFCYPNPSYDGKIKLSFTLDAPKPTSVRIFNVRGEMVWSLTLNASQTRIGKNIIPWDGSNQAGDVLASGIYLYSITVGEQTITKKAAIIH